MCFSANMSLGFGMVGLVAATITYRDKTEPFWVRLARSYAIFHFSLMEFIQYFRLSGCRSMRLWDKFILE